MTMTDTPPLTAAGRRRVLCELADLYTAEQNRGHRPISEGLPALLPNLCASHVPAVEAIDVFARFARARAVLSSAAAGHADMDIAEREAEQLLDELVGESEWLREQPEPVLQQTMAAEAARERARTFATGEDVSRAHPLSCRCRQCQLDEFDPAVDGR